MSRVLVGCDEGCPTAAIRVAGVLAGDHGEVVLGAIVVVPLAVPLDAALDGAVADACAVLDRGERLTRCRRVDTRLLRARSFAEGVLTTLASEPFSALILELGRPVRPGGRSQIETLLDRARVEVILVRPDADGGNATTPRRGS